MLGPCGNSTSNYSVRLRQSAPVFLSAYSLDFDDSYSRVSRCWRGTDLGAGRIYCLMQRTGSMDLLPQWLVRYSNIFKPGLPCQHPSLAAEGVPEYLAAGTLLFILLFICTWVKIDKGEHLHFQKNMLCLAVFSSICGCNSEKIEL